MSSVNVELKGGSKYRAYVRKDVPDETGIAAGRVLIIKTADAMGEVKLCFDNKAAVVDFHGAILNALLSETEGE
jgi:hypothetical protein